MPRGNGRDSQCTKEKSCQDFYVQKKNPSEMKEKLRYSKINKNWDNSAMANPLYNKYKGNSSGCNERIFIVNSNLDKEIKEHQ